MNPRCANTLKQPYIDDICCASPNRIAKYYLQNVHPGAVDTARMLLELIFIGDGSIR